MICRHLIQMLCWMFVVNSAVKNVRAISFDDIFEYFLDAVDDSNESSEELTNSNLNVTCKNCNVTVQCYNYTHSHKDTQSTIPMQISTKKTYQQSTSTSLPTPTIPVPEWVAETLSTKNDSSQNTATVPTIGSVNPEVSVTQTPTTKSIGDESQVTDDANLTTDSGSRSDDGVTGGSDMTTQ